jgi:hypothetical protein
MTILGRDPNSKREIDMGNLQIGDTIICSSQDDMVDTMMELAQTGIETDFVYGDKDKYKLVVTDIEEGEEQ